MAFVIRSERDFKLNIINNNSTDIGPGEYLNTSCKDKATKLHVLKAGKHYTTNSNPPLIPFNSTSERNTLSNKDNFPGPGSYNKTTNTLLHVVHTESNNVTTTTNNNNNSSNSVYKRSHKHIGFLTNAKRFETDVNDNDALPGPGQYETLSTFAVTSPVKKGFFITKTKLSDSTNRDSRVVSIPTKDNIGYYLTNGEPVLAKASNKEDKFSGLKGDSVGPGRYNVDTKWEKNFVKWKCDNTVNKSLSQKSFEIIQQPYKTQLMRRNNKNYHSNTNSSSNGNKLSQTKNVIFKQIQQHRKDYVDNLSDANSNILNDLKYADVPGPGFYERDSTQHKINYFEHKSHIQNFGSKSPKFKPLTTTTHETNVGPGSYFKQRNKYEIISKSNTTPTTSNTVYHHSLKKHTPLNNNDDNEMPMLLESIRNKQNSNSNNNIGPGSYNLTHSLIKKECSNVTQFGSIVERFKQSSNDNQTPAPGTYNPDHSGQPKPFYQRNIIGKDDMDMYDKATENKKKEKMKSKEKAPPVGSYNPGIVSSIQYAIHSKLNPYKSKLSPFNGSDKRFSSGMMVNGVYSNDNNIQLGPGAYNIPSAFDFAKDKKVLNQTNVNYGKRRTQVNYIRSRDVPGPGEYDPTAQYEWKKKSFNVLFI